MIFPAFCLTAAFVMGDQMAISNAEALASCRDAVLKVRALTPSVCQYLHEGHALLRQRCIARSSSPRQYMHRCGSMRVGSWRPRDGCPLMTPYYNALLSVPRGKGLAVGRVSHTANFTLHSSGQD